VYLVDTNIFIEFFLGQEKAKEAEALFEQLSSDLISMTEFSLYSIGIILVKNEMVDVFDEFVQEEIIEGKLNLVRLAPEDMKKITATTQTHNLDFDDAYQYTACEKYNLELVSFDSDFDKTKLGRVTPQQVLEKLKKQL